MINTVTPEFVKAHTLDVSPLSNLVSGTSIMNGCVGLFTQPLGYIIIRVQVEGCGAMTKIKWPWSFQIQLTLAPRCQSFWAHQLSTES